MGNVHWFVLTGTRGASDRAQILQLLGSHECSTKRLADVLDLEYGTVQEHLRILEENDLVQSRDEDGVAVFSPTPRARREWDTFAEILEGSPVVEVEEPTRVGQQ